MDNRSIRQMVSKLELFLVVLVIAFGCFVIAEAVFYNFTQARRMPAGNACVNNLRQIDAAKQQWALEMNADSTATPTTSDIQPYLGRGSAGALPFCPLDSNRSFASSYIINMIKESPQCRFTNLAPFHVLQPSLEAGPVLNQPDTAQIEFRRPRDVKMTNVHFDFPGLGGVDLSNGPVNTGR